MLIRTIRGHTKLTEQHPGREFLQGFQPCSRIINDMHLLFLGVFFEICEDI